MAGPVSPAWFDLFEENRASNAESSLESYESLNKLDAITDLSFLKDIIWEEIRTWVANNTDPMSAVHHQDLDGPGLVFLGGMNHALNDDTLRAHDISAVISIHPPDLLAWHPTNTSYGLRRFQDAGADSCPVKHHLMIPLEDKSNADLMEHFGDTYDFMWAHLREGRNVLVHCKSGRSRSVAVVIAYLQRKHYEAAIRPRRGGGVDDDEDDLPVDEALGLMVSYREATTESVRRQRLPVSIIMERFETLLQLYDLRLLGHPSYERERAEGQSELLLGEQKKPASEVEAAAAAAGGSQAMGIGSLSTESLALSPQALGSEAVGLEPSARRKRVIEKGGAAVLKICTAIVFFKHNQKPPVSVVERLLEINEAYFYKLEGSEYNGISYAGDTGHAHRGICSFYATFADQFGYEVPSAIALLSSETKERESW